MKNIKIILTCILCLNSILATAQVNEKLNPFLEFELNNSKNNYQNFKEIDEIDNSLIYEFSQILVKLKGFDKFISFDIKIYLNNKNQYKNFQERERIKFLIADIVHKYHYKDFQYNLNKIENDILKNLEKNLKINLKKVVIHNSFYHSV